MVAGLRRLGVRTGETLGVHCSLGRIGHVEGGAATVIAALIEVIGPDGALVMPATPVSSPIPLTEDERRRGLTWKVRILPFDDHTTRTGMGAVADAFRDRADVIRSDDKFSLAAWGRDAAELCRGYQPLLDHSGRILLLGVEMDRCSALHLAEKRVALPDDLQARLALPDELQREYPPERWSIGYGPEANFLLAQEVADAHGLLVTCKIGAATVRLFDAQTVVTLYETLLREDPYLVYGLTEASKS